MNPAANYPDPGIGFNTPTGRFSVSLGGLQLGGHGGSMVSVGGVLTAVLVSLAVLAAFGGLSGALAVLRTIRRRRQTARRGARIALAKSRTPDQLYAGVKRPGPVPPVRPGTARRPSSRTASTRGRTREELYAEARRRNLPGRSQMTKAQLERALYPPQRMPEHDGV